MLLRVVSEAFLHSVRGSAEKRLLLLAAGFAAQRSSGSLN